MLHILRGDTVIRRIVDNGAWLLAANGVSAGLLAIKGLIVARALGVEGFGVVGLIATFVTVLSRLTSFRMSEFVVQFLSRAEGGGDGERRAVLRFSLYAEASAALVAFAIVWLIAPIGARYFVRHPDVATMIRLYATVVLLGFASETATGILQMYGRFRSCSIATTCGAIVTLAGTVAAVVAGVDLRGVILAMVAGAFANAVALWISAAAEARRRLGRDWWAGPLDGLKGRWRSVIGFVLSTNASATLSLVTKEADLLWLGLFRGPAEAGLYRLAFSLAGLTFMPTAPLAQSIYPEIAREAARAQWQRFGHLLRRGSALAAAYVVPVVAIVSVASAPVISLIYGPAFEPAVPALIVLLVGMGFSNVFFWSRPALLALDRADYPLKVNLVLAALKAGAIFAVIPVFGYLGTAAILAASYLAGVAMCVWKARQLIRHEQRVLAVV